MLYYVETMKASTKYIGTDIWGLTENIEEIRHIHEPYNKSVVQ